MEKKLDIFLELLLKWQNTINLISESTKQDVINRHIRDSEKLLKYIPKNKSVLDLGTGGGFPGIVLGIYGYRVFCIESDVRKSLFLKEVKRILSLDNVEIINNRVEKIVDKNGLISREIKNKNSAVIVCRAFASIKKIFDMTYKSGLDYFLLKGENFHAEIKEAENLYDFDYKVLKNDDENGVVLDIKNVVLK